MPGQHETPFVQVTAGEVSLSDALGVILSSQQIPADTSA
jgi:hypothetical protein